MKSKMYNLLVVLIFSIGMLSGQGNRPQEPVEPFPYISEDVLFENTVDGIGLAGTLTFPKGGENFPAVILISGSGPQDRNSELLGHKSFLVISDFLTKNGIAVLRVDDRETGESGGKYNETGLDGFVRDTEAAYDYLLTRTEVNKNQIGLIGHSLGGTIAPMIASKNKDIAYIVLLAAPGMRGDKLMLLQKEMMELKMGFPEAIVATGQKNIGGAYDIILTSNASQDSLRSQLKQYFSEVFGAALPDNQNELLTNQLTFPWLMDFLKFDPIMDFKKINCPVLALNGELDLQVPASQNLLAIENGFKAHNKEVTTLSFPKLNHLFQESETGLPMEYGQLEQTFSPDVMTVISDWILEKTK